ncbi:MAG: hypothetical protein ACSLFK_06635 [Gemmatimonadaceae bacterium]
MRTRSAFITMLLAVSGAAITAVACTPDATAPAAVDETRIATDRKVQELRDRYGWVGQYHTDGLEYVFAELSKNRGKSSRDHACRIAAKALKEFHRQARRGEVPFGLVDPAIEAETCGAEITSGGVSKSIITGNPRVAADELLPLAVSYIDQVNQAVAGAVAAGVTREGLLNQLITIQYAAVANLPPDHAGAVVAVVSIALSSLDYWEANMHNWVSLDIAKQYSRAAGAGSLLPIAAIASFTRPNWWSHPFVQGYIRVVSADVAGGARVLYTTWRLGPIGWDAAAAAALWSSVTMMMSLLF